METDTTAGDISKVELLPQLDSRLACTRTITINNTGRTVLLKNCLLCPVTLSANSPDLLKKL